MTPKPERVTPGLLRARPLPEPGSSKLDRGDVLVIGGARTTPGAAALAGLAALRVGAGRLTLAVAGSVATSLAVALPEAAVIGLPEDDSGCVLGSAAGNLEGRVESGCILFGPGLDDLDETSSLLRALGGMIGDEATVVLDAYALGALAKDPSLGEPFAGRLAITPNPTEAGILLGRDIKDLTDDVSELARRFQAVVSCQSTIANPTGGLFVVEAGGPGLGTSGSGDVQSGALAGLAARGAELTDAALWSTYLHAEAGDRLAQRIGPLGYLARELLDELPPILAQLS